MPSVELEFGGGVHSRASEEDIHISECTIGQNFDLDPSNRSFRPRKPFDLLGTTPNAAEIRGFANLLKSDGSISMLVQAGAVVYEWDGLATFTQVGTCDVNAQLRGKLEHNFELDDKVIIVDINLRQPVMEWDGTTLQNVVFTTEDGSTAFGVFKARHCVVSNERAIFANVHDNGTNFPHLIIGCQRSDFTIITVANRPSSSLSDEDPFFLVQPDLKYINGLVEAFGIVASSSREGSMFKLTGSSAKDFAFDELYPRSGASGEEATAFVGNDIFYGRPGRIESLSSTDKFGDVDADDLSFGIFDLIEDFKDWTIVYNARNQRVYCYAEGKSQIWVFHKSLVGTNRSPWVKWTTLHSSTMNPTVMMNMLDPQDGLEYVFFGDASGNFYRMEGVGGSGDGGSAGIISERLSGLVTVGEGGDIFDLVGWVNYKKDQASELALRFEYRGQQVFDELFTLSIPAITNRVIYNGGFYYNNGSFYGSISGKLNRQPISIQGQGNSFQVRTTIEGTGDFEITGIGINFNTV